MGAPLLKNCIYSLVLILTMTMAIILTKLPYLTWIIFWNFYYFYTLTFRSFNFIFSIWPTQWPIFAYSRRTWHRRIYKRNKYPNPSRRWKPATLRTRRNGRKHNQMEVLNRLCVLTAKPSSDLHPPTFAGNDS